MFRKFDLVELFLEYGANVNEASEVLRHVSPTHQRGGYHKLLFVFARVRLAIEKGTLKITQLA